MPQALLIGGDNTQAAGPFQATMDVLRTGVLEDNGIKTIGVAGHPKGHPVVSRDVLRRALVDKCEYADKSGMEIYVVIQFLFDTEKLFAWHADFIEQVAPGIPVDVGFPGLAKMTTLLRFAKDCGVSASLGMMTKNVGRDSRPRLKGLSAPSWGSARRLEILTGSGGSCRGLRLPQIQGSSGYGLNPTAVRTALGEMRAFRRRAGTPHLRPRTKPLAR
jgi:methylenetetrahydrofolate reductase (NADPH)